MHSLQKQFHDFIEKHDLFTKNDRTLVAVSGGLDSMVLAELFLKGDYPFAVAHCNFGLRGEASDLDEQLVGDWCKEKGLSFHVQRFDLGPGSTQLNARNARYDWFDELCQSNGYSKLVTAHHLDDSLETSLINLTRGTGPKGIYGIKHKNGTLVRPLLFATKDQLNDYATKHDLSWREDASNATSDYNRNFVRLEVIPKLQKLNPSLASTFSNTSERLQFAADVVADQVQTVKKNYLKSGGDLIELSTDWISKGSDLLLLSEILSEYGFSYVASKEVFLAQNRSGKLFLSSAYELTIDRTSIFIKPISSVPAYSKSITGYGQIKFEDAAISIRQAEKSEINFRASPSIAYFDEGKLSFPLVIRVWREGDRFQPLGMQGSKKVSDYLIDSKVPVAMKGDVLVLISGEEIIWLIGHQISEKVKLEDKTSNVIKAELL